MPRDIDDRKKRKALRKLRAASERAKAKDGSGLSDWEQSFMEDVEARIEQYGAAFGDLEKGGADEPLSRLQQIKLKEIERKSRGKDKPKKPRKPLSAKRKASSRAKPHKKAWAPRSRDINEDIQEPDEGTETCPTQATEGRSHPPRLVVTDRPTVPESSADQAGVSFAKPQEPECSQHEAQHRSKRPAFRVIQGGGGQDD